ncbi:hypothetical protein A9Q83_05665 [Alphaproteobacteria bacterium 46_93_T64]|nr:hypothetical protein A9Q83_05665 [Alphaproteobacteria bacterium 46_93_T64]
MSNIEEIDYGPLGDLIGVWKGREGVDIAPEPEGTENNLYHEVITYSAGGSITNAESQTLAVVHYRQVVRRISNEKIIHDQTGYWMWDATTNTVMHAFAIPRGICVLAGGIYKGHKDKDSRAILELSAKAGDTQYSIIESPFMQEQAVTVEFRQKLIIGNGQLSYFQTTMVDIYGKMFEHTDCNELTLSE